MAGAAFIEGFIVVRSHSYNRAFCNRKAAIIEESRVFLPLCDLDITGDINCPTPGILAEISVHHPIEEPCPAIDFRRRGRGSFPGISQRV